MVNRKNLSKDYTLLMTKESISNSPWMQAQPKRYLQSDCNLFANYINRSTL